MTENQQERRLTFQLLCYWNELRADREFPRMDELHIEKIEHIWHNSFVIDMREEDPAEWEFQYFGSDLVEIFEDNWAGEKVFDALQKDSKLDNTISFYRQVKEKKTPISESSEFLVEGQEVRYRSLIVPMSSDGKTVDYVIGTTNYKVYA